MGATEAVFAAQKPADVSGVSGGVAAHQVEVCEHEGVEEVELGMLHPAASCARLPGLGTRKMGRLQHGTNSLGRRPGIARY